MPTTARLPPLDPPYPPDAEGVLERMKFGRPAPIALFRTLAHNPRVLDRIRCGGLLDRGSITLRQREIVILRTTALCGAGYEWGVHVTIFAEAAGLSRAEVHATLAPDARSFPWSPEERLLIEAVDALHRTSRVDDALHAALAAAFSPAQLVEIVVLAGFYHAISFAVNAFAVAPEPWAAPFPATDPAEASAA